eukprot:768320-Hanusia_phi.AAC.11
MARSVWFDGPLRKASTSIGQVACFARMGRLNMTVGKFGRFELYCAADMERRMSSPFDRELLRAGTTSDEPSPGRSLESLFAEDYNNNVLPSEVTDSLQASTVPSARDTTARPNAGSLQPTFTETAASQANNSRARYKNPLNRSSLSQIETISLTGSISNGNAKTPPQEPSSKPPVKKLTIVESPERCRPAVQFGAGSPEINAENSPDTAQPGERSKPQSLVSMVVKNPLRQGLEWAESSKSSEEQAYPQSQTDPSLMTLLVKRPLRLGLELADTMTDQAKEDQQTSPSLISHVIKQPIRNSGLVLPEEASEGNKDPSLLTIVIKRPLQQFVWGSAGAEASKDADDQQSTQDMETGVEQDDEHWNFGVPTQKDESKDATGTENIQDQPIPAVEGKSGDGTEEIVNDGLAKIEEDVEYDPDTMMPVKKDLLAQADDEEEMELDPDTLMPIPKKKANQLQAAKLPNFTSFRARKLIGANTKPPTARVRRDLSLLSSLTTPSLSQPRSTEKPTSWKTLMTQQASSRHPLECLKLRSEHRSD